MFVCVHLLAKSGHHGDLLNRGLLNDTSGWQQCHTHRQTHMYTHTHISFFGASESFVLTICCRGIIHWRSYGEIQSPVAHEGHFLDNVSVNLGMTQCNDTKRTLHPAVTHILDMLGFVWVIFLDEML